MIDKAGRNCRIFAGLMLAALIVWLLNAENIMFKLGVGSFVLILGLLGLAAVVFLSFHLLAPSAACFTQALLIIAYPITLVIKWLFGINPITSLENLIDSIQEQRDPDYKLLLGLSVVLITVSSVGCTLLIGLL